jgi:hypothetical protein
VVNKKEEANDEEERISNQELLAELKERIKEGKISPRISAVSGDSEIPEMDIDLKDNESNFRINLKEMKENEEGK